MYNENFEKFTNPMTEWYKLSTNVCRNLAQQQLEYIGDNVARISGNMNRLAQVKTPEDFINIQKECINENVTATMTHVQKLMQISMANIDELTNACSAMRDTVGKKAEKTEKFTK